MGRKNKKKSAAAVAAAAAANTEGAEDKDVAMEENKSKVEEDQQRTSDNEGEAELPSTEVKACTTPDCSNPGVMQCPTCIKLHLPPSYFCGQQCFASFWKYHKLTHKKPVE